MSALQVASCRNIATLLNRSQDAVRLALTLFSLVAREMRCDFRVWLTAGNSAKQAGRVINRQEARRMPKMKLREPGFSDCFRFDSNANSNF